ncbi:hypothetical protein L2E82_48999 [Cichorium intybus]|uniref:Uncharacterized protein n=1 Tax=Cichorium intybus TaxID=13427 RepID=A0ACB8Z0B2_CICIN|nr:hypothetical protein L2E82_48999 [Cichorium intybus]
MQHKVEDHELSDVATISAGNDYEVGSMISEAIKRVGRKGTVIREDAGLTLQRVKKEMFGSASKVVITKDSTLIVTDGSTTMALKEQFVENAKLSANYFIANCEEMLKVAAVLDELPISLHDKYLFCLSPADMSDEILSQGLTQFAHTYAKKRIVRLREIFTPGTLQVPKVVAYNKDPSPVKLNLGVGAYRSEVLF